LEGAAAAVSPPSGFGASLGVSLGAASAAALLTFVAASFLEAASGLGFLLSLAIVIPGVRCLFVMLGLMPGIHVLARRRYKDVDGRVKPSHDGAWISADNEP
jgi:hypothetical protein